MKKTRREVTVYFNGDGRIYLREKAIDESGFVCFKRYDNRTEDRRYVVLLTCSSPDGKLMTDVRAEDIDGFDIINGEKWISYVNHDGRLSIFSIRVLEGSTWKETMPMPREQGYQVPDRAPKAYDGQAFQVQEVPEIRG